MHGSARTSNRCTGLRHSRRRWAQTNTYISHPRLWWQLAIREIVSRWIWYHSFSRSRPPGISACLSSLLPKSQSTSWLADDVTHKYTPRENRTGGFYHFFFFFLFFSSEEGSLWKAVVSKAAPWSVRREDRYRRKVHESRAVRSRCDLVNEEEEKEQEEEEEIAQQVREKEKQRQVSKTPSSSIVRPALSSDRLGEFLTRTKSLLIRPIRFPKLARCGGCR